MQKPVAFIVGHPEPTHRIYPPGKYPSIVSHGLVDGIRLNYWLASEAIRGNRRTGIPIGTDAGARTKAKLLRSDQMSSVSLNALWKLAEAIFPGVSASCSAFLQSPSGWLAIYSNKVARPAFQPDFKQISDPSDWQASEEVAAWAACSSYPQLKKMIRSLPSGYTFGKPEAQTSGCLSISLIADLHDLLYQDDYSLRERASIQNGKDARHFKDQVRNLSWRRPKLTQWVCFN